MRQVDTALWTQAECDAFEDECFANWLNKIDAYSDYEWRREHSLVYWRELFNEGATPKEAISICQEYGE